LERRHDGHPVLRSYYRTPIIKQYDKADTLLRTEAWNDSRHLGIGRRLDKVPTLVERMAQPNPRSWTLRAHCWPAPSTRGSCSASPGRSTSANGAWPALGYHRRPADGYRPSQLGCDLGTLRAHGPVERLGRTRRYCLSAWRLARHAAPQAPYPLALSTDRPGHRPHPSQPRRIRATWTWPCTKSTPPSTASATRSASAQRKRRLRCGA
jgi:hypothetical protein